MPEMLRLDRCPACRARLADSPLCPRCGCDFTLARQAMAQAGQLLEQGLRSLARGDRVAAQRQVDASLALHRQRLAEAIRIFLRVDRDGKAAGTPIQHAEPATGCSGIIGDEAEPDSLLQGYCC